MTYEATYEAARRAEALLDLDREREAVVVLTTALAEDPEAPALLGLLARAHLGLGELDAALAVGNRLVAALPDDEWGHRICAIALLRAGRAPEGLEAAAAAVRLEPEGWMTHRTFAEVAVDVPGRGIDARAAAERAVWLAPNEPAAHFVLGLVAQTYHDDAVARSAYERVLALQPDNATAVHNLTVLDGGLNLAKQARGYGASLRLDPHQPVALQNVDGLTARFLRRLYWATLALLVVGLGATFAHEGDGTSVTPLSIAVAVVLVVGVTGYTWVLGRSIPVGIRRYAVGRLWRDGFRRFSVVVTVLLMAVTLVVCLVPGGAPIGIFLLRPLGIANVVALLVDRSRSKR